MSARLKEFRALVKEVARNACRTALMEAGFIPDYGSYDPEFPGTRTVQVLGSMAPGYCGLYRRFKSFTQTEFVQSDYSV